MNFAQESKPKGDNLVRNMAVLCGAMALVCALSAVWFFVIPEGSDHVAEAAHERTGDETVDEEDKREASVTLTAISMDDDAMLVCFVQSGCVDDVTVHVDAMSSSRSVVSMSDGSQCRGSAKWSAGDGTEIEVRVPMDEQALVMVDSLSVAVIGAEYEPGDMSNMLNAARRTYAARTGSTALDEAREMREKARVERREAEAKAAAEAIARKKAEEEEAARRSAEAAATADSTATATASTTAQTAIPTSMATGPSVDDAMVDVMGVMAQAGSGTQYGVVIDLSGRGVYVLNHDGTSWSVMRSGKVWCDAGLAGTFSIVRKAPGVGNACMDGFGAYMSATVEDFSQDEAYVMGHETIVMDGLGHWVPSGICAGDADLSGTQMEHSSDGSVFVDPDMARFIFEQVPEGSTVVLV